jgi:nucleoid DNA-binding protein
MAGKKKTVKKASPSQRAVSKINLTKPLKATAASKARSKGDVFRAVAELSGVHRRDVAAVLHAMGAVIKADLSKAGAGVFKVPGLMRIVVKRKPATKAHMGINPFTKEQVMFKAKPARNVVRVRPLQGLRDMV